VISIKKFLAQDTEPNRAFMHVVRTLVDSVGRFAVAGEAEDCAHFRESVRRASETLVDEIAPEELLLCVGSVVKELENHNRNVARYQNLQTTELRNMVKMLTSTVGKVSSASQTSVSILGDIEKHIAIASAIEDVRVMRSRLSDCLAEIRNEAGRQQAEAEETIRELRRSLEEVQKRSTTADEGPGKDPVTGLPLRSAAEAALAEYAADGAQSFAAVMVMDHLQMLNTRFGREATDEMLAAFSRMVRQELDPADRLFRWGGPALLALLRRPTGLELVRSEIARILEKKLEHTIQTKTRSVLIPISVRWCLFPVTAVPRLIYKRIDTFSALPARRG
jgi:GGDEF domain-containing protein